MLRVLSELNGVAGNEEKVADFILSQVSMYADEIIKDTMGNLIFLKKGKKPTSKKIAVFAHMDEVGLICTGITDEGYIKFNEVGHIDDRVLLTQKVLVGDNEIEGVIGIKAVHLQEKEERNKIIKKEDMYIDIGANSKEDAEKLVSKGDYIALYSPYVRLYGRRFKAKAIDDRVGCAIMMELMHEKYDCDIYFCFSVQEEMGMRGASVLTRRINPDAAIVLEATTASDTAFVPEHLYCTRLGDGPAISLMDKGSYSDIELRKFIEELAGEKGINYQYKRTGNGANDSRVVQIDADGCKVASISLPCRYIHSAVSVADGGDYDEMKRLVRAVLNDIGDFLDDGSQEEE